MKDKNLFDHSVSVLYEAFKVEIANEFGKLALKEAMKKDATMQAMHTMFNSLMTEESPKLLDLARAIKVLQTYAAEVSDE